MMKSSPLGRFLACICFLVLLSTIRANGAETPDAASAVAPAPVLLWPNGAPYASGNSDEDKPAIYPFPVAGNKNTGAAMLICPGGGFTTRCVDYEGVEIARWMNARGIAGFVLRYRIQPLYRGNVSSLDAQRAVEFLRAHADEYHINPSHIGIMGFSAGSELACNMAYRPAPMEASMTDALDKLSSRPDFIVLAYGSSPLQGRGGGGGRGGARGAAAQAPATNPAGAAPVAPAIVPPPTFMFCTSEDTGHINGMLSLYADLRAARVPTEVHFFLNGEHGVGLAQGDPVLGQWPELLHQWMLTNGYMTNLPRVAMHGLVTLDGKPLPRGYVIFTPIDSIGAPSIMADVFNSTGNIPDGVFRVRQNQGPTPGKYHLEVHQDAQRWLSNSKNQEMIQMQQKQRNGAATDADQKAYEDWAHHRDLEPTIENQRVFTKAHGSDKDDLVVEIKPGTDNEVNIDIFSK